MKRAVRFLTLALLFLSPSQSLGTAFYFMQVGSGIYIGGDTYSYSPGAPSDVRPETVCKMVVSNQYALLLGGYLFHTDVIPSHDGRPRSFRQSNTLVESLNEILSKPSNAQTKMSELAEATKKWRKQEYQWARRYGFQSKTWTALTQATLLYWESGKAKSQVFAIKPLPGQDGEFQIEGPIVRDLAPNIFSGAVRIDALNDPNRPNMSQRMIQPKESIDWLLTRQSQITPKEVQQPFTTFLLTPTGGKWLENGDICKANSHLR